MPRGIEQKPLLDSSSDDSVFVSPSTSYRLKDRSWIPTRYVLVILAFFGFFNLYALRVNLSMAIVAMAGSPPAAVTAESCSRGNGTSSSGSSPKPEFQYDSYLRGIIMGSFFYGYIFTQLPGAWIAKRFGAKQPFGLSAFVAGLLALLLPVAARWSQWAFIGVRVLQGVAEGVCFPSMHTMLAHWAPPLERTRMVTIAYSGMHAGTVGTLLLSGVLAEYWGWESIFYFFGACACGWYVIWHFMVYDTPDKHPRISAQERSYIITSIGATKAQENARVPWKKIFLSMPFWAICVGHVGNNWGFYTLLTNLPTYFSNILRFSLQENGFISALPYLIMGITMPVFGLLADRLRKRRILTITYIRKIFHFIGQVIPAVCLVAVGYVGCDTTLAVALLTLAVGSSAIAASGFQVNHIDISPTYGGILMGLTNTLATIPGMVGPYVVGLITSSDPSVSGWRLVFYISAAVYVVSAIFYSLFASGEPESWEKKKSARHVEDDEA